MTDDDNRIELTRRKILGSMGAVGVAGAGAGLGSSALFNDTETFANNTIVAGELDLKVDWEEHYSFPQIYGFDDPTDGLNTLLEEPADPTVYAALPDPENPRIWVHQSDLDEYMDNTAIDAFPDPDNDGAQEITGVDDPDVDEEFTYLPCDDGADLPIHLDPDGLRTDNEDTRGEDGEPNPLVNLEDVKPGDFGEFTLSFHLCNNPGFVRLFAANVNESENGLTDPESEVDETPEEGELAESIETAWWIDDGNNVIDESIGEVDVMIAVDTSNSLDQSEVNDLADDATDLAESLDDTGNANVGGLSFDDRIDDFQPLSGSPATFSGLTAGGNTAMPAALEVAAAELDANGRSGAETFIVLFTDGGPNYPNTGYATQPIGGGFTPGDYTEGSLNGDVNDGELCETANIADTIRADHRILAVGIGDDEPITGNPDANVCEGGPSVATLREYLRDHIAGDAADFFSADETGLVEGVLSDILEAVAMSEEVFFRGSLEEALTGPLAGDGRLLDGDRTNEEPGDCFDPGATHYIGFAWWLPEEVGNEVQGDAVSFDLGFLTEQCRNNDVEA